MGEKHYIISEAAKEVGVESHVLRYWEEELGIPVSRNELGHRFYTEEQIKLFKQIKDLKETGFQLKAVKNVLDTEPVIPGEGIVVQADGEGYGRYPDKESKKAVAVEADAVKSGDKLAQFEIIMTRIISKSMEAENSKLGDDITTRVSEKVIKEMDYLLRLKEESEDERFKKLDETIRMTQKNNKDIAVFKTRDNRRKKRALFWLS